MSPIALYYDQSGYVETTTRSAGRSDGPAGLMGREVAGKEFLDALLRHGTSTELTALTRGQAAKESLTHYCRTHPSSQHQQRRLRFFDAGRFHDEFLVQPPAPVLHFPNPADPAYAWARQTAPPHRVAFSGVTHTLCSARAIEVLRRLVTDPWEEYDRLICTSTAVHQMVTTVTKTFADYLRTRHGGDPTAKIGLETIPLGVNTERFQPATVAERTEQRQRLKITDDEIVVLFVGRLSHHAKAHPFPMFRAAALAAERSQKKLRLLLCGWSPSEAVETAFRKAALAIADNVQVDIIDGLDSEMRSGVWKAADIFLSLVDNIQETFGLVIIEAMASGLPVIASDWNGYRDLVVDGQTGFLTRTWSLESALPDLTSRLLLGEINYDHFLARATQSVAVHSEHAADVLTRLCDDEELRRTMGQAGRKRTVEVFDWSHIIRQYEAMWQAQDQQRQDCLRRHQASTTTSFSRRHSPAAYPPIDHTFHGYPTKWLTDASIVVANSNSTDQLRIILSLPLMTHEADSRCADERILNTVLQQTTSPTSLMSLANALSDAGVPSAHVRSTLAWLLKYDLLVPAGEAD